MGFRDALSNDGDRVDLEEHWVTLKCVCVVYVCCVYVVCVVCVVCVWCVCGVCVVRVGVCVLCFNVPTSPRAQRNSSHISR